VTDIRELIERLRPLVRGSAAGLFAFDADGTLWSGDVGDDVFHAAVGAGLLREAARPALMREASAHDLDTAGGASELAARIHAAYLAGRYPERSAYAMMAWCYAGFSRPELTALACATFERTGLAERLHGELEPILRFAREASVRIVIVSASPHAIVCEGARLWGIEAEAVAAARPALDGETILDHLVSPVPYAEGKLLALRELSPEGELIASFGDSVFDIELLRAAQVGVAVRPKPALRARLPELAGIALLDGEASR
jgi:phosphatidylglycerophosphatase C